MSSGLVIELKGSDNAAIVRLSGNIDEDNALVEQSKKINKPVVVLSTANVERINSCGVRDWVTWLNELEKKGADIYLIECSPSIMTQVNLVNNFVGTGTILSFYAPYFCSSCNSEKMLLIKTEEAVRALPFRAPTCRCDQCDHTMQFDDIESSYFAFLSGVKRKPVAAAVAEAITLFSTDTEGKLRSRASSVTVTGSGPALTPNIPSTPTIPGQRDMRSLLPDSSSFNAPKHNRTKRVGTTTNIVLYLIIGLLALAIGMLAYVVVRAK
jgi:anti-anti-sigma regulatory factor